MNLQTTSDTAPKWAEKLVETLSSRDGAVSLEQACEVLKRVSISEKEVLDSSRFNENFYTRTSIFRTPEIEVLIMPWLPGQMSPPHNHKGSICAVRIVVGDALEVSYERNNLDLLLPVELAHFSAGSLTVAEDEEIHQFGNGGEVPMVSVHVYSPPLHSAEIFPENASILSGNTLRTMNSSNSVPSGEISLPVEMRVV